MAFSIIALLLFIPVFIAIGTLIGAIIYRAACAIFNGIVGGGKSNYRSTPIYSQLPNDVYQNSDTSNPYSAPAVQLIKQSPKQQSSGRGIPNPTFGNAILIVFLTVICNMLIMFLIGVLSGILIEANVISASTFDDLQIVLNLLGIAIQFGLMTIFGSLFLPTSMGKSAIVTVLFCLIGFIIGFVIFLGFSLLMFMAFR